MSEATPETVVKTPPAAMEITPERIAELEAELERLRKHNETVLAEKKAEADARRKAQEESAKRAGDIEALEKSWQEREASRLAEIQAEIDKRDNWLREKTVNEEAARLAADLAVPGSASVLEPHIRARLAMEVRDGRPVAVVLDKDGKPGALTIADLRKEIESNAAFAPVVRGTNASGAGGINGKAGGPPNKELKDWSESDKALYIRENGLAAWTELVAGKRN